MANIIDYINWRGDLSFSADEFNPVDNLVFARLAYFDFDDITPSGESLGSITERYKDLEEKMYQGLLLNEDNQPFIEALNGSTRFGDIIVREYVHKIDLDTQLQFSAVCFEMDKNTAYIAFRGTDDTLVGWKEDFNMSFMDVVPAQKEAASYLQEVMGRYGYETVYVGGHSKGGNLAVYAAVQLAEGMKSRVAAVYNNDGPGFKTNLIESAAYRQIADRVTTLVPESSIVGLLLTHEESYQVVRSSKKGILQHDAFSWEVMAHDFIYLPALSEDSLFFDATTKRMLEKMSLDQRETFSTVIFNVLSVNEGKTLTDLSNGGIGSLLKMTENYHRMDRETKKIVFKTISLFFDESYQTLLEVTELGKWHKKIKAWREETKAEIDDFFNNL